MCYLVGNRADLGDTQEREVTTADATELMKELNMDNHMETSALTGANIGELFVTMTKHLYLENSSNLNNRGEDDDGDYEQQSRSTSFNVK